MKLGMYIMPSRGCYPTCTCLLYSLL